ncbi:MAG: CHC2 zinc finger domain-containing protein [Sphingomonas paucimobilis]
MDANLRAALDRIRNDFSLSAVAERAGVKLRRVGNEWKACCPFHTEKTPSFTIYAGDRRFMCFGCNTQGDVLDFMKQSYRVGLIEAARMLDSGVLGTIATPASTERPRKDWSRLVARIWGAAQPITGTPAARYLRNRGIYMDPPNCLRFARLAPPMIEGNGLLAANGPDPLPALVAAVTGPDGALVAIQRTYLTEDGRKAAAIATEQDRKPKVKYSLGNVRTGAIRLGHESGSIIACEGLEDGLTLMQALGRSVWVAAGTSMLPHMAFPDVVRAVVIGADGDAPGRVAAEKAATAYAARELAVRIMYPAAGHKDFNAELDAQISARRAAVV